MKERAAHHCSSCQREGHNRATCPDLPKKPPREKNSSSPSWLATEWLRTNGGTLLDAARQFHVSRQAVQQMWDERGLGDLPSQQQRTEVVASLAQYDGMTMREIVEQTGLSPTAIRYMAEEAGICVAPVPSLVDQIRPDVEELLPRIRAQTITLTEVAHRLGVTPQILHEALTTLIDGPRGLSNRGRDHRARVDGKSKSQRGSELVDAGMSVREACAQVGVAARCVYKYRKDKGMAPTSAKGSRTKGAG